MYSPRWLFLVPGAALALLGIAGYAVAMPGMNIGGVTFDAHTLLFASLFLLCGYQSIVFAIFTKIFAIREGLMPEDPTLNRFFRVATLETGLIAGLVSLVVGVGLLSAAVLRWGSTGFGGMDYPSTMRWVIPGATLTALGVQTMLSSFFASILGMGRK